MTTIPGWDYDQPTEKTLLAEFGRSMGADAAGNVWAVVCRRLNLARPVTRLEDLIAAGDAMIELGDTVRVAGRGAEIRLLTYRALQASRPAMTTVIGPAGPFGAVDRLRVLATIDPDDAGLRADLDSLAENTARRTGMPTSMASLVLGVAQVAAGSYGLTGVLADAQGTPIEWALCSRTVASGLPYIVPDATIHPVEARNPLVTMDGLRSYAGFPVTVAGHVIGAACVLSDTPHHFTDDELTELSHAADAMSAIIEQHRAYRTRTATQG